MADQFVITGSGRCGTTWISRALTRVGVPTGHEAVFNPWSPQWPDYLQGDSSWVAACELDRVDALGVPVALLVRHPLQVVRSLVEIGFFDWDTGNDYHRPLREAFPEVYDWGTPQDRALEMWLALNSAALTRAELVLRFELVRADPARFARLLRWIGVEGADGRARAALTEPPCNRHEESRERTGVAWESTWEAHDLDLTSRAQGLARILGYRDEED